MPRFRVTAFMDQEGEGWSEGFHTSLSSPSAITTLINSWVLKRRACMTIEAEFNEIRVSDDETFRDILTLVNVVGVKGQLAGEALPPINCALFRLQAGPLVSRPMFVHGLPKALINGRDYNLSTAAMARLNEYAAFLKSPGFSIAHKVPPTDAKLVIAYNATTGLFTVSADIPGLTYNMPLVLTNVKRSIVKTRIWRVATAPTGSTFTLQKWVKTIDISGFGKWRSAIPVLDSVTESIVRPHTTHKVGRPFGLPRGRVAPVR